jgi:hypothetical protein
VVVQGGSAMIPVKCDDGEVKRDRGAVECDVGKVLGARVHVRRATS